MKAYKKIINTIDEYISQFSPEVQDMLNLLRKTIKEAAPDAYEKISYGIPTFELNGNLVHFGAFKHHIGFYPSPNGIEAFKVELSKYKQSIGSVQFPMNEPLPCELITEIVKFRVNENLNSIKIIS